MAQPQRKTKPAGKVTPIRPHALKKPRQKAPPAPKGAAQPDTRANRSLLWRVIFLMCVCGVLIFIPLLFQLYQLQITQHDYYKQLAVRNQTQSVTVSASRGTIYDTNGDIMAMSATVYNLVLSPRDAAERQKTIDEQVAKNPQKYEYWNVNQVITDYLTGQFGLSEERVRSSLEKTSYQYIVMVYELSDEQAKEVRQFISDHRLTSALYLSPTSKRYYPNGSNAAHILGFMGYTKTSGDQKVGAYGIEANYESTLAGKPGLILTAKNAAGTQMLSSYESYLDADNGSNITLTIDNNIQSIAEQALETGIEKYYIQNGGFIIVMDPNTGAILAMASSPDYDPNRYDAVTDARALARLEELAAQSGRDSDAYKAAVKEARDLQWKNKTLSDTYEPGSTFKALVVAAALEEGVVSLNDTFYCGGQSKYGGFTIHCHKTGGHGSQTLTRALENSCNVALMEIGMRLGADRLWDYFEDYGLMEKTGIDLAGEGTSIFWPGGRDYFTSEIGLSSVAVASFGQTFKVSPIRMITSFASVINGGHLITPYLVQSVTDSNGNITYDRQPQEVRQVLSESTSEKLCAMLESVVVNGSGQNAYNAGCRIGGKTGTSEKRDEEGDDRIVSFMGFAPANDPQVLVLVAFDTPQRDPDRRQYTPGNTYISGGNIGAPVAGALIAQIMDYMKVEKQYLSSEELSGSDVNVPSVVGKTLAEAKTALSQRNLNLRTVGSGDTVTGQIPVAGAAIPGGSSVILYMGEEPPTDTVIVPNLVGKSPTAVENALNALGLYVRATGVAVYTSSTSASGQSIAEGTPVSRGTVIEVRFGNDAISDYIG